MGPRLLKFGKIETVYSLRAFPIGGFCAMEGEDQSSDNPRAFGNKPVWKRILVVAARAPSPSQPLNLAKCQNLSFYEPDLKTFTCLSACQEALKRGGLSPTAANGANEAAVALFLQNKISFLEIGSLVMEAMLAQKSVSETLILEQILEADRGAREFVQDLAGCR